VPVIARHPEIRQLLAMSDQSASEHQGNGPTSAASPAKPASYWEDFIDIFYAPSEVFRRREHSGFGVPMLVITLLIGILMIAMSGALQPIMDAEFTRNMAAAMRKNPNLTPEMAEKGRAIGETFAKIGAFIFVPVGMFFVGLALWLCGKLVDARQTLAAAIMVAAYSFTPRVLETLVKAVQALFMDPASLNGQFRLSLSPARFLDPDTASALTIALLSRLDVFTIWVTVLLAIGLSVTGKIPRQRAAIAAGLVWLLGAVPLVLSALRS
jgi:hypothetical protein